MSAIFFEKSAAGFCWGSPFANSSASSALAFAYACWMVQRSRSLIRDGAGLQLSVQQFALGCRGRREDWPAVHVSIAAAFCSVLPLTQALLGHQASGFL